MLMYYEARTAAGEMHDVHVRLHEVLRSTYGPTDGARAGVPESTLKRWGKLIKDKFDQDNLHLTSKQADAGMASVVEVVQQLGQSMASMQGEISQLRATLASLVEDKLERVTRCLEQMSVAPPSLISPARALTSPARTTPANADAGATPAANANATTVGGASSLSPDASACGLQLVRAHILDDSARPAPLALKGTPAGELYRNVLERGGQVPAGLGDGDRGRVRLLLSWFNAMASEDERKALLPTKAGCEKTTDGEKRITTKRLHDLVVARFSEAFTAKGAPVPPNLAKGLLPANGVEDRIRELKKIAVVVVPNSEAFRQWRAARESTRAAQASTSVAADPASALGEKRRRDD
jgi:hypothetical protein